VIRQGWPSFQGYPFQERWVHIDGLAIHYVDEGAGGDPVLMIHGNPAWSYMWRRLIPPVALGRRTLALDLMGFGKSEKPNPNLHDFPHHANIVSGFIGSLGLRHLTLILHDWGAAFGMQYAVRHQNNISGLILTNTFLTTDAHIPPDAAAKITPAVIKESSLHPDKISGETMTAYWAPFPDEDSKKAYMSFARMFPDSHSHPSFGPLKEIQQALPHLKIPTLIIWGTRKNQSGYAERIAKMIPESRLEIVNAGHFVPEDAPEDVEKLVLSFLAGTAPAPAQAPTPVQAPSAPAQPPVEAPVAEPQNELKASSSPTQNQTSIEG
jgi:haloalkane dehalogenase